MSDDTIEELSLADWRRRISALYVEVRRLAEADPAAALEVWRVEREALFRDHPDSPVPADSRRTFRALHFGHDPTLRFEVVVERDVQKDVPSASLGDSGGRSPAPTSSEFAF